MTSKITKRLIITNILILVMALLCFYIVSVYNLNAQAREQAERQIIAESSTVVERTSNMNNVIGNIELTNSINNPPPYNPHPFNINDETIIKPSQNNDVSIHIFCDYGSVTGNLVFPEKKNMLRNDIVIDESVEETISSIEISSPKIIKIGGENYLVLITPFNINEEEKAFVSLLAMDSVNTLTTDNIILFSIFFVLLIAISFSIIYWQSMKITAPLKIITKRSEKYANRDYSEALTVETGDEIESLSKSIQTMVDSIIAHEKSQTSLFRNLSHELKTPLTAISGYAQNIQNGYYEDTDTPLTIIQEECTRIRDILDNLIFLSKIDSNVEDFNFKKTDVVNLLTMSVEKIESIAILKDVDLFYSPPKEIYISCDNEKIIRAFINILSNAIRHTKDYVQIMVDEHDEFVSIIVLDNGSGFSKEKLEKLFFSSTGESVDGNGLGLMIVYEIIKQHGGAIDVRNNTNGGAEVILSLPK